MSAARTSPLAALHAPHDPVWEVIQGMAVPLRFGRERGSLATVALADASCLTRIGWKGAGAADWLAAQGLPVPSQPNTWLPAPEGGIVARLGRTEFFAENDPGGGLVEQLQARLLEPAPGVYAVPRQDTALLLAGARAPEVLARTCPLDLRPERGEAPGTAARPGNAGILPAGVQGTVPGNAGILPAGVPGMLFLTLLAGISVLLIPQEGAGGRLYRIWCDASYGEYLWETLSGIAHELGGGPVGVETMGWRCEK